MIKDSISISFYLRSRSVNDQPKVYLRLIVARQKTEMSLGHSLNPEEWDEVLQRAKKNREVNESIVTLEAKLFQILKELDFFKKSVTIKAILDRLNGRAQDRPTLLFYFKAFVDKLEKQPGYSRIMIQKYRTCYKKLEDFLKLNGQKDVFIDDLNYKWIQDFDHYLLTCINTAIDKPIGRNTANKQHARLRTVLKESLNEDILKSDPYSNIKFKSIKSTRSYLSSEELDLITKHDLGNNLSLIKVRDVFIFSVYTGLRYIDAMSLLKENVYMDKNQAYWIQLNQEKTDEGLNIPLLKQSLDIYTKYEVERKITGFVLPRISNQKVNAYLKIIAELTGIKKKLTHHVARHTCATTVLLDNDVPMEVVSKWLGHNSMKTTQIYGKITPKKLQDVRNRINNDKN